MTSNSNKTTFSAVGRLFRWKPVTAWGFTGIMIAVACALNSGLTIDWINLLLVGFAILIIQGIIAHGVNDLADYEVDSIAPIEETGRSKVLVSGELSRSCLFAITSAAVLTVLLIIILLQMRAGIYVLIFAGVAAYAVFGYSTKPLRLGWRPFSEVFIVMPTITAMICGVEYVMISTVTTLAFMMGISYGFFNASWFMYSRAQDYEADKELGKRTTIVHFGLDSTSMFAQIYLAVSGIYAIYTATVVEWYTAAAIISTCAIPAFFYVVEIRCLDNRYVINPTPASYAKLRLQGMKYAVVYGVCASLAIIIFGGIS
ncbi:MAG: hypothetical protein GWP10_10035 [Nitrospiraceae bacterium]|nr:hypothetical protein [Nitrospiraceae bacterium]